MNATWCRRRIASLPVWRPAASPNRSSSAKLVASARFSMASARCRALLSDGCACATGDMVTQAMPAIAAANFPQRFKGNPPSTRRKAS